MALNDSVAAFVFLLLKEFNILFEWAYTDGIEQVKIVSPFGDTIINPYDLFEKVTSKQKKRLIMSLLVGAEGFEPPTLWV